MNTDVELWRTFVAAAEELHFARAAERVHLDPSGISRHVRQLESRLSLKLFDRTTRQVSLTDAGHALLPHARRLLEYLADVEAIAQSGARAQRRQLRVGCSSHAVSRELLQLIGQIAAEHELELSTHDVDFEDTSGGVRAGVNDAAIVFGPVNPHGLAVSQLATVPRVAVVAEGHPLASRPSIDVHEILDEPWTVPVCDDHVFVDDWTCAPLRGGAAVVTGALCRTAEEGLLAVLSGQAVSVGATARGGFHIDGIVLLPLTGIERAPVLAITRHPTPSPVATAFIAELVRRTALPADATRV